jgi:hypothetical protein
MFLPRLFEEMKNASQLTHNSSAINHECCIRASPTMARKYFQTDVPEKYYT